jgi:hypothetical protein
MLSKLGYQDFPALAADLAVKHPHRLEEGRGLKISAGAFCLNDPEMADEFLAVWTVGL